MKSGDGERTAMLGYLPQYKIAANLIYDSLLNGTFEWIRVADPEVGQLDDIQLGTEGRVDAYQVKWAEYSKSFPFNGLIKNEKNKSGDQKPSLIQQLSQGWEILKHKFPGRHIEVHLINKHHPSTSDTLPADSDENKIKHSHFQAFLKECFTDLSWVHHGLEGCPEGWRAAINALLKETNLKEKEFLSFLEVCDLSFDFNLDRYEDGQSERRKKDIDQLLTLLLEMAGGEKREIECDRDNLLSRLGWGNRFALRFSHEFPVHKAYQPISKTIIDLEECLNSNSSGYAALLGTPGSGKSTTLTHTLRYKKGVRLIRYYAYVPDSSLQARGEASNFLHDITTSLHRYGFRGGAKENAETREDYIRLLGSQLAEVSEKWQEDGVLTLIMVDGLDHIQRELNPQRTLLADLPPPSSVPNGILFILGSQTLELNGLSEAIKSQLKNDNRTINMSPLERSEAHSVIGRWPTGETLSYENKDTLFHYSQGHPLALIYYLSYLTDNGIGNFSETIASIEKYQGHIDETYSLYWSEIEKNEDLVDLLALIARLRTSIDTRSISRWSNKKTIRSFLESASHYFMKDVGGRWSFFHNSFKQFILNKTVRDLFGNYDESANLKYHGKLSELCKFTDDDSPWKWERLYHLFHSNQFEDVITLGKQDYFRNQFFKLRHVENIYEDITLLLLAAKKTNSPISIIRAILIETELRERNEALGQINFLNLIYKTEGLDSAIDYAFSGKRLRVSDDEALSFCSTLIEDGHVSRARELFQAAEPLDLLSGSKTVGSTHESGSQLGLWAELSYKFLDIDEVLKTILQIRKEKDFFEENEQDSSNKLHNRLIKSLWNSVCHDKNEVAIVYLFNLFKKDPDYKNHFVSMCMSICRQTSPKVLVDDSLNVLLEYSKSDSISESNKILIAELIYRRKGDHDLVLNLLDGIEQPQYDYIRMSHGIGISTFIDKLRINRLFSAIGRPVEPMEAVPNGFKPEHRGYALFERFIIRIANLWGKSWEGEKIPPSLFIQELKPSFDFFLKNEDRHNTWHGWYSIKSAAPSFYNFAIQTAKVCGDECLFALKEALESHWKGNRWPASWMHEILLSLYEEGGCSREVLKSTLDVIKTEVDAYEDVHSRIEEYSKLSVSYADIEEREASKALLPEIVQGSFGIYHHKDRQFSHWVSWLENYSKYYPNDINEDIRTFSCATVNLQLSGNGRGTQEAARDLIKVVSAYDLESSINIIKWMFNQGGLHYSAAITGLLEGMLVAGNVPLDSIVTATVKLLIPFEEYNPSNYPEHLAVKCFAIETDNTSKELIERLIKSVDIDALPSNRREWYEGILKAYRRENKNVTPILDRIASVPKDRYSDKESAITLNSGEQLTNDQVLLKINSVEDLLHLFREVKDTKYPRWDRFLDDFINLLNVDQVEEIISIAQKHGARENVISNLASRLISLGEVGKAHSILEDLIKSSEPRGWDLDWDGGSRQKVFKTLVELDKETWRSRALESLIDDYIGEYRYPSSLIWNLEEIVEILFAPGDILEVWNEIKNHFLQLSDFDTSNYQPPKIEAIPRQNVCDEGLLIKFIFYLSEIIIPELQDKALQALVALVVNSKDRSVFSREITERLKQVGAESTKSIFLLEILYDHDPDLIRIFASQILSLRSSNDFVVRRMATRLSSKLGLSFNEVVTSGLDLPLVYKIELPEIDTTDDVFPISLLKPGDTLPDMGDAIEILRPFDNEAELISRMSSIPLQNIVTRAVQIMNDLRPESEWNANAEKHMRKWLKGVDLELSYQRLRPRVAQLALSHVASELIDADMITEDDANFLEILFRRADSNIILFEPTLKPSFIHVEDIEDKGYLRSNEEWSSKGAESLSLFSDKDDQGRYIIGELTQWSWLDWKTPKETRITMVCHPDWPNADPPKYPENFFPYLRCWAAEDYPFIPGISEPSLIIYGSPGHIDYGGTRWLALNPNIAQMMGWQLDGDNTFRWLNANRELMVESIYWKDGPINRQPPKTDDVCSDGWLVVATRQAVQEIRSKLGNFVKIDAVMRSYGRDSYSPEICSFWRRNCW